MTLYSLLTEKFLKEVFISIYKKKNADKRLASKGCDGVSLEDFFKESSHLENLFKSLNTNAYKTSYLLAHKHEKQKKGKYRLIGVATVPDRVVQKAILRIICKSVLPHIQTGVSYCGTTLKLMEAPLIEEDDYDTNNTRRAFSSVINHIKAGNFYPFKSDIRKFYDTIPKRRLDNKVTRIFKTSLIDESLNWIIKDIIFFKLSNLQEIKSDPDCADIVPLKYYGIPQGSPLSQLFANIYLIEFDKEMHKEFGDRFLRYIDDFIVFCSSPYEQNKAKELSVKILKRLGLLLDESKNYQEDIRVEDCIFLGIKISRKGLFAKESPDELAKWTMNVLNFKNKSYYSKSKTLSDEEKVKRMNDKIQGKARYLRYYHTSQNYFQINAILQRYIKKDIRYKKIALINFKILEPMVKHKEWNSYF